MTKTTLVLSPGWVKKKNDLSSTDNFFTILKFYVFSTPCLGVSSSGISMKEYKWGNDVWKKKDLRNHLMRVANLENNYNFGKAKTLNDISRVIKMVSLTGAFQKKREMNRVAFYNDGKYPDFLQIFYYIRCALAHGRFEIYQDNQDIIYVMEAVKKSGDKYALRARMVIKEKTLIEWCQIIERGSENLKKEQMIHQNTFKEQVLMKIKKSDEPVIKKQLIESLPLNKNEAEKLFTLMKNNGDIYYDSRKMTWMIPNNNN